MARVVVRDESEERARELSEALARELAAAAQADDAGLQRGEVNVSGPMPCPIARIADRWRMQLEVVAAGPGPLGRFLTHARNAGILRSNETYAVDVDPVALM
jgi:primosomal protein N'